MMNKMSQSVGFAGKMTPAIPWLLLPTSVIADTLREPAMPIDTLTALTTIGAISNTATLVLLLSIIGLWVMGQLTYRAMLKPHLRAIKSPKLLLGTLIATFSGLAVTILTGLLWHQNEPHLGLLTLSLIALSALVIVLRLENRLMWWGIVPWLANLILMVLLLLESGLL